MLRNAFGTRHSSIVHCGLAAAVFFLSVFLFGVSAGRATSPTVGNVTPAGAQRGTEIEVTIGGQRLKDAQEVIFYEPGVKAGKLELVNDGAIKTRLVIEPQCRLGTHAFWVRTATGVSNKFLFSVGALPEIAEVEPNHEFTKPQVVQLDVTINGTVAAEDIDYFAVTAKKGERITAEIEGIRLGRAFFDPYVAILDPQRFELANSDDAPLLWHDAVASIVAPDDGTYMVAVRESSNSAAGVYRLHLGRFPRPTAILPAGGKLGEKLEVTWLGDKAGPRRETVTLPAERDWYSVIFAPDNQFVDLFARDERGVSPSPVPFRIGNLSNAMEVEPNNEFKEATPVTVPAALNGVIGSAGDIDRFKFTAKKGQVFNVRVHARSIRSPLDSVLTVSRATGQTVAQNDDSGSPDSYLRFTAPDDGDFVISVNDLLKEGGVDYVYRVEVSPVEPWLTLGLPERQQYIDVTTAVPRGNRITFLVSANRRDFGGELAIEPRNLPAGVRAEVVPMLANQSQTLIALEASADAPLAGTLVDLVGRTTDPKLQVEGHLSQTSLLVRGQNNRPVWTHTSERMATAVAEKVPYHIEIIEPKVPIVRSGSMDLRVRAVRDPAFKGPIAIRMLYNPPGVASQGGVTIPEGKDEASIALTANATAEIQKWKIAVLGEAGIDGGSVLVSSPLAKLEVADAYFALAFKPAATEQGKEAEIVVTITHNADFPGNAKLELVGLPAEVTAEAAEINKDAEQAVFKVKTTAKTPAGRHKAIHCRAVVTLNGEPIAHTLGPAELRVDAPLPPKPTATPAKPAAPAVAAAKPAAKPLSRLEQLRQEREGNKPAAANNNK